MRYWLGAPPLEDLMRECIAGRGGDVATATRAATLMARYETLEPPARERFIDAVAAFGVDRAAAELALAELAAVPDDGREAAERRVRDALLPARVALLRAFTSAPGGVKFLVELRGALMHGMTSTPERRALAADVRDLLATLFQIGLLELRRITWDTPASLLERLARYEAVHEVRGWVDLKNRLDNDRRCFAFFHPAMPDEPLIFVEVALTDQLSGAMAPLLDSRAPASDPSAATHAIFYSISNCQRGLEGISFGNALLKRVVRALADEFRSLRTFATLSPLPGFRRWVESRTSADKPDETALRSLFDRRTWARDDQLAASLRAPLTALCAHYLLEAKRPNGKVLDPVAHFHLSNGARLERINWLADLSPVRVRESAGMMVNYIYRLDRIDELAQAYVEENRVATAPAVSALLSAPPRLAGSST